VSFEDGDHQFFLKEAEVVWKSIQNFSVLERDSKK